MAQIMKAAGLLSMLASLMLTTYAPSAYAVEKGKQQQTQVADKDCCCGEECPCGDTCECACAEGCKCCQGEECSCGASCECPCCDEKKQQGQQTQQSQKSKQTQAVAKEKGKGGCKKCHKKKSA